VAIRSNSLSGLNVVLFAFIVSSPFRRVMVPCALIMACVLSSVALRSITFLAAAQMRVWSTPEKRKGRDCLRHAHRPSDSDAGLAEQERSLGHQGVAEQDAADAGKAAHSPAQLRASQRLNASRE
jgi:hypothetical protein